MFRYATILVSALLAAHLAGCASSPTQSQNLASIERAEQTLLQADAENAAAVAAAELRAARTKLAKARAAERQGDSRRAQRLAAQALMDARLALARAQGRSPQGADSGPATGARSGT